MTAKRRTFRGRGRTLKGRRRTLRGRGRTLKGRRRTLKGGNCCDYETINAKSSSGCVTEGGNYIIPVGSITHGTLIENQTPLQNAMCIDNPIDLTGLDVGILKIKIQYHALKHMDMYEAYTTCNKQYEYIEALRNMLIDKSDDILKMAQAAIADSKTTFNAEFDFLGKSTTIRMNVIETLRTYVCTVYQVTPVSSDERYRGNNTEKFNIYQHKTHIYSEANNNDIVTVLRPIQGKVTDEAILKRDARIRLNKIAGNNKLTRFSSFTLDPGRRLLELVNNYIQVTDPDKSGCKNGRRTYAELLEFIKRGDESLILGMIGKVRSPDVTKKDAMPVPSDFVINNDTSIDAVDLDLNYDDDKVGDYVDNVKNRRNKSIAASLTKHAGVIDGHAKQLLADEKLAKKAETEASIKSFNSTAPRDQPKSVGDPGGGASALKLSDSTTTPGKSTLSVSNNTSILTKIVSNPTSLSLEDKQVIKDDLDIFAKLLFNMPKSVFLDVAAAKIHLRTIISNPDHAGNAKSGRKKGKR